VAQAPITCDLQRRLSELLKDFYQKLRRPLAEKFKRQPSFWLSCNRHAKLDENLGAPYLNYKQERFLKQNDGVLADENVFEDMCALGR